jgi:hypothetical protein
VEQADYVAFIARAQDAVTIGDLHAIAVEVRRTYPGDPDATRVATSVRCTPWTRSRGSPPSGSGRRTAPPTRLYETAYR